MLNKSCELFSAEGHVFSISALRRAWRDLSTCRDEEKKAFLNLWNMACSILIVNWVFLHEWSESGAAEVTVRNENTRLNQHLCHPKAFSTAGEVFSIFLLFPPASFRTACWANACVGKSLCILMSPQKSRGEDDHSCCTYMQPNPTGGGRCVAQAAFPWIFMPLCSELRSEKVMIPESTLSE